MDKIKNFDTYLEEYGQRIIDFLPSLIGALLLFIVGIWIIRIINGLVRKLFIKKDYDPTLENFIASLINWGLKIILFVLVVSQLGVESASLVAIIGAAGLAIGLALQGSLANFAGGVLILLLKPFKLGDFIKAQGIDGTVKEISIFTTKLTTPGNQLVIIPNGKLSNENIINYTSEGIRKEMLGFGISYDSDIKKTRDILLGLAMEQELVFKMEDKMPIVVVTELADSSVNLQLRYWTKNEDFWNTRFYTLEEGKMRLEAAGISIPFPQRDVHLYTQEKVNLQ
ncbi:mechanosensitive ion channel family protein [Ulvibacter antarcticus]|uniref:Small conductance mechanosensitive channel n=1 Tax=Ulvibacter antarcticus TaxID=442714 RepID=A0A3L9YYC5_9FLAO|nr:mechanosensitive ion channel domain-containing protein [Ulvibacter antarcticus]RMA65666.1 small conductance mechanosensitive channel [Ulvibacter antarcticus]